MTTTTRPTQNALQTTGTSAPAQPTDTLEAVLKRPDVVARFSQAMPKHFSAERMMRLISLAAYKSPNLTKCNPWSVIGAGLTLGSLGLEPNTPLGQAYLVPFKNFRASKNTGTEVYDLQVLIGYQGKMELWHRSGLVRSIEANVVYEGDEFEFEFGSNAHLKFRPAGDPEGRRPIYAYAYAKLKDGGEMFEVLPYARVLRVRNKSQAYQQALRAKAEYGETAKGWSEAPWVAFEDEMACKTLLHRLNKRMPKSVELQNAQVIEELFERQAFDLARVAHQPSILTMPETAELPDTTDSGSPVYVVRDESGKDVSSHESFAEAAQQFATCVVDAGDPAVFCEVNRSILEAATPGSPADTMMKDAIRKATAAVQEAGGQEAIEPKPKTTAPVTPVEAPAGQPAEQPRTSGEKNPKGWPMVPEADPQGFRDWTTFYQDTLKVHRELFPGDRDDFMKHIGPALKLMDREAKNYAADLRKKLGV